MSLAAHANLAEGQNNNNSNLIICVFACLAQ
jgi:hypothetical protein